MRKMKWVVVLAVFALVIAACGDDDATTTAAPATTAAPETTAAETTAAPETTMAGMDLSGTDVSLFGAFTTVEQDAVNSVIDTYFNQPTGANAFYEGSESFEEQIKIRVEGGNPPDIALYPQPGSVLEMAESGDAIALEDLGFDITELEAIYGEYLMGLGEYEGKHYGLPTNVNSKSLVWYHIPTLETNGIAIPTTWEELKAASQTLLDAGVTPWCIGTGSDAATGWPATDWMEDIMLRTAGVDLYDQWVAHEIPFNHESVLRAANLFDEILAADGWVLGGRENVPDIDFRDAPDPMADGTCAFHRQASFIVSFFPEGTVIGEDVGVFAFPDIDEGKKGALIAGELAAIFADRPEVRAFLENFTSVEVQCAMGNFEGIGRISPHTGTSGECYLEPVLATASDSIVAALIGGGARFDASDLMPSSVGSGSFWTGMNEWMRGKAIEDVLAEIEASWP